MKVDKAFAGTFSMATYGPFFFSALTAREIQFSCPHAPDRRVRARFNGLRRYNNARPRSTERPCTLGTIVLAISEQSLRPAPTSERYASQDETSFRHCRCFPTHPPALHRVLCTELTQRVTPRAHPRVHAYANVFSATVGARRVCWLTAACRVACRERSPIHRK